jgi:RNA polymerase sigma factor (sigma-70 family)
MRSRLCPGEHNQLTAREERLLADLAHAGSLSARNELVERNLRLVPFVLNRFVNDATRRRHGEDLEQVAAEALIHAADKYRPEAGRFHNCALWWIRQRIYKWLRTSNSVVRPHRNDTGRDEDLVMDDLHQDASPDPGPEEETAEREARAFVRETLAVFPVKTHYREVLRRRLLLEPPDTLEAIGQDLGMSREAVRQIQERFEAKFLRFLKGRVAL